MTQLPTAPPELAVEEAQLAPAEKPSRRMLIIVTGAILLFVGTYVLAWLQAYNLSRTYLQDANNSYQKGNYLDALVGYKEFDRAANRYIHHGGYMQIQSIWSSAYAQPPFPDMGQTRQRIDEIINQRITIEDAEQFVQENIGKPNPYLGLIYLRLGELYEAAGRVRDAEDVYKSVPDLFKDETTLVERANTNLERLKNNATK